MIVDKAKREVQVRFTRELGETFWREEEASRFESLVAGEVQHVFPGYRSVALAAQHRVSDLVPNTFRDASDIDRSRLARPGSDRTELWVRSLDRASHPARGLDGRHIAMWPSHGWYFEPKLDRWEWQRARVFTTVEDLLPFSFIHSYLAPMLERAGANVILPRERDTQTHEVIVDYDSPGSGYNESSGFSYGGPGFASRPPYGDGVNPFALGTYRIQTSGSRDIPVARWTPDLPEAGDFAVYVSYVAAPDRTEAATYTVHHAGGETRFSVNQTIGGGTWVYLGTFRFRAGTEGSVSLSSSEGGTISADAVRFGGGMGVIERGGSTSGRPRFVEGARYYEQFAGAPTYVYNLTGSPDNDYRDDFASRGEWVNWLRAPTQTTGESFGPVGHRDEPGLGVPVDLSLAFHTDAGVSRNDTTIGTLLIFHTPGLDGTGTLPDGVSRLANRDFADMLQTQVVDDIRALYDPAWNRRGLWDRDYSEGARPNVPSALLELLSHQNYLDMKFGIDPRFRFDASRAIYKAMGRFLADHHGTDFIVQPLAVTHTAAELASDGSARLSWRPQHDPLEPSAEATGYVVYKAQGDSGFDNGTLVDEASFTSGVLEADVVHRFRIAAVNDGGESAWSEEVAVGRSPGDTHAPVLIVNGFDRVAPPSGLEEGNLLGFAGYIDQGVPDGVDVGTIGDQYNFAQDQPWLDDDNTGHGSSNADYETRLIAGNTHDFAAIHGAAILAAGRSFTFVSDEAASDGDVDFRSVRVIDLILGEEKTTPSPKPYRPSDFEVFPVALRDRLGAFRAAGGKLFVSGAYVGTDIAEGRPDDDAGVAFLSDVLGIRWRTNHAATDGRVVSVSPELLERGVALAFNAERGPAVYSVEAPDGIEPASDDGRTVLRYAETNISAGVVSPGSVVLGFPFETILDEPTRNALMASVLRWLETP